MANNSDHNNMCNCIDCSKNDRKSKNNYNVEQVVKWLEEYGLYYFIQYPNTPPPGVRIGHMVRYTEDLAQFLVEKLNND